MSTRILAAWYRRNQDSPAYPPVRFSSFNPDEATNIDVRGDHDQVIRKVGAASIVLLKNKDNVLPLRSEIGNTLAVIGTNAKTATDPNVFPDRAGVDGHVAIGWGSGTAK